MEHTDGLFVVKEATDTRAGHWMLAAAIYASVRTKNRFLWNQAVFKNTVERCVNFIISLEAGDHSGQRCFRQLDAGRHTWRSCQLDTGLQQ